MTLGVATPPPPPQKKKKMQTWCSHDGFGRDSYCLQASLRAFKKPGGFGAPHSPPPFAKRCSQNEFWERFVELKTKSTLAHWEFPPPPHLQTQSRKMSFARDSYEPEARLGGLLKSGGVGGGAAPPICKHNSFQMGFV